MPDENEPNFANMPPIPDSGDIGQPEIRPWEQRAGPGMSGGSGQGAGTAPSSEDVVGRFEQACLEMERHELEDVIEQQTDLVYYAASQAQSTPDTDLSFKADDNAATWNQFLEERLYDTRHVTLEHFHLFDWFPLTPGRYHTPEGRQQRREAVEALHLTADGRTYYSPKGKAAMIGGGIGAVRLRPRELPNEKGQLELHYFMTASSSSVCHEGFPVLIPRRFYGPLKARMLDEGAAPVTITGEMRCISSEKVTFFGRNREIPRLYLHAANVEPLPAPRAEVTTYYVSVAVAFAGQFQGQRGRYLSFATFDPARREGLAQACNWLEEYVVDWHDGAIITDFDEGKSHFPSFPRAIFSLAAVMSGDLLEDEIEAFFGDHGLDVAAGSRGLTIINTQGGAYVGGSVYTEGGDFIGRDNLEHGVSHD